MPEFAIPAETLWTGVTTLIVALLGSRLWETFAHRHKTAADTDKTAAEAAQIAMRLMEEALDVSERRCDEAIRLAVAESERRCEERAEVRKVERDEELRQLKVWAAEQVKESCRERKALQLRVDELTAELDEIVRNMK